MTNMVVVWFFTHRFKQSHQTLQVPIQLESSWPISRTDKSQESSFPLL